MIDVLIPAVGESVSEVTIGSWLKPHDSIVKMDEPICLIESDKASLEIAAPKSGKLIILIKEGETVAIGAKVAQIDETASQGADTKPIDQITSSKVNQSSTSKNFPSPSAAKILAEKDIDPSNMTGSGKDGRITKEDALRVNSSNPISEEKMDLKQLAQATMTSSFSREIKREKMTSLRKTIANRLVQAKNTTAMLTTFNEVDMTEVMNLRKKYKDSFKEKYGIGLGFMSIFTKAVCLALNEFPAVNAIIEGTDVLYHHYCDIGVAVSTPKGLVVPVVRNAQSMGLSQIEMKIMELATKARDGKLSIDEMQGGTFTITNGGVFGSMLSTPIINIPQSAILGMHNIVERAVVINHQIVIRPIMYVALSYDHRIIDGRESVSFLKKVKEYIEDPARLILEV